MSGLAVPQPSVAATSGVDAPRADAAPTLADALRRAEDRAAWIQDICAALGTFARQDELLDFIMGRVSLIMNAERALLYMRDDDGAAFYARTLVAGTVVEARVLPGQGIVGWVATSGKSLNLRNAQLDPRYDASIDARCEARTTSVLCQPMRDRDGVLLGVIEVANKRTGYFSVEDEGLLSAITNTASIVIQNQQLFFASEDHNMRLVAAQERLRQQVSRLDTLHRIHQRIAEAGDLDDSIEAVAHALGDTVLSYGCAVSLIDNGRLVERAWERSSRSAPFRPARRTWDPSIRAHVMETGASTKRSIGFSRPDAAAVTGRMPALGSKPVTSVAAVPLRIEGAVFGCVELVNRARDVADERDEPEYDDDDVKLMDLVASEISRAVASSLERRKREEQGRLLAIGQMLSGVVHDSRTPLAIASGYVQLMARTDDPDKRRALAEKVARQFASMEEMTRELLAYARGETTLYLRTVHLHALAEEVRELLDADCRGCGVDVTVTATNRDDAKLDEGKLKRVIFNLARNARDAMPGGGRLSIDFGRDGDTLVVRVSDTGKGIPSEIQTRVFDAFVTAGKPGGSGLGLAIVQKLVHEHGGTITFTSTSRGTTFTIRVPTEWHR